jgi:hypothetical protein
MKIKALAGILMTMFILGCISTAAAANYDGYAPAYLTKGESFKLDLLYNEWIDDDGYDHNMLNLTKKERSNPIDGYWLNMYTFKSLKSGTTKVTIKMQVLWWEEERTMNVNIK